MSHVLTLIAGPDSGDALEPLAERLGTALSATPDWLAPGEALDLAFDGLAPEATQALAAEILAEAPLDWVIQAREGRRKAVFLADLESTIIGQEMLDELAGEIGRRDKVADITARAMAGELDFAAALAERVGLLRDLPATRLDQVAGRMTLNPGARALVRTLTAAGVHSALVSGGFTCFAEPIAEACCFHQVRANRLQIEDGRLTGRILPPLLDGGAKLATLEQLAAERDLTLSATCAIGDGANDAPMLAAAGLGIAYRAKPPARAVAAARLDHGDLTGVLYLQGYRKEELAV